MKPAIREGPVLVQTARPEKFNASGRDAFRASNSGRPAAGITRDTDVQDTLARLDALAKVMDSAVTLPGTTVTIGVDALLGLLPVIGDAISTAIGGYLIWEARRLGASKIVIARMATNTAIDGVLGAIPMAGDVFDVAFRSNRKNIALLRRHIDKHGARGDGKTIEGTYSVG